MLNMIAKKYIKISKIYFNTTKKEITTHGGRFGLAVHSINGTSDSLDGSLGLWFSLESWPLTQKTDSNNTQP